VKNKELLQKLQQSGGYIANTHVEMTGLDHSDTYLNKDLLLINPVSLEAIADSVNQHMIGGIEVVCGPPLGGILLAEAVVLSSLEHKKHLKLALTEKHDGKIRLKRGQAKLIDGKGVLVVDDVLKTGRTLSQTVEIIENAGGNVRQIVVLINWRGENLALSSKPTELLPRPKLFSKTNCPMCREKCPIEIPE